MVFSVMMPAGGEVATTYDFFETESRKAQYSHAEKSMACISQNIFFHLWGDFHMKRLFLRQDISIDEAYAHARSFQTDRFPID